MADAYIEISAQDNPGDVSELVKHVADQVDGVAIETKEGGHIKMSGSARIQISGGVIKIG